jgi:4-amino-4-deoxy-L-arabinose transferase-like glycosyltransferase
MASVETGNEPDLTGGRQSLGARAARITKEHWPAFLLIAFMAGAFFLRLYYLSRHTEYTADSYYFLILARSIRDTFTYTVRGIAHTKYLPGYPIGIWLGSYLFGGLGRSANLIAILAGTLTVLTTYLIGKELLGKWVGLVAALIIAFQPTFLKWTSLPMTEGMFTLLFTAGIYFLITGCRRASPERRALGALAGGICLLTRWEGLLFLPLMVLIPIIFFKDSKLRLWEPVLMLALFGLPIGVYVIRNVVATGRVTSYVGEFREYSTRVSFSVLKHRAKVYGWNGMSDALFSAFFYIGSVWFLVRRKWRAFLIVSGWFALFLAFHLFWYYAYERFMAPAAPAVAIAAAFLLADLAFGVRKVAGTRGPLAARVEGARGARFAKGFTIALQAAGYIVLAGLLVLLVVHGAFRANRVIAENYKAFADDHGGKGMAQAAEWLETNTPGALVAADAGPYFQWEYPGDVLYLRPIPWDLPVEDRDVGPPDLASKLRERGVRYVVIGQTDKGLEDELQALGMGGGELKNFREVARWVNHYDYPEPHELTTVVFEVLPPGR